jgi:hypothetical protein
VQLGDGWWTATNPATGNRAALIEVVLLAGQGDADLGFVVDDLVAGVLANRDARGQAQRDRDRHRELALAGGRAVDEQLQDAGRALALERLWLAGGLELEAQDVPAGRDLAVGNDLEVLLSDVVVGI